MLTEKTLEILNSLSPIITNYLEENKSSNVIEYKSAKDLTNILKLKINSEGSSLEDLMVEVKNYLNFSTRTSHPQFNNQLTGGFQIEVLLAEVISILGNATMATYEVAPVATLMEAELIKELNAKLGYQDGDGIMLTGGSNANLMAIHCARQKKYPESKFKGNMGKDFCIYVSKEAHYSHKKAMMLMGLGLDNLIQVEADELGKMNPVDLKTKIQKNLDEGRTPLMICSTAGTTVLGAFDPIEKINSIAKEFKLWHHIDGAWGGAVMFSSKYNALLKGCENADSFTFDAHKLMGAGLITSFFLTKHSEILKEANGGGGSHYIFHEYENAEFDTGKKSLQCGRKVDSLKFWLLWKSKGHSGFEKFIHDQYEKQNFFLSLIKENPRLKLIQEPEFLNVCFQVIPKTDRDINKFNFDLRFKLVKTGKMLTNFSSFADGTIFFRHVFANNLTTKEDLKALIDEILTLSHEV